MGLNTIMVCSLCLFIFGVVGCRSVESLQTPKAQDGGSDESEQISLDGECSVSDLVGQFHLAHREIFPDRAFYGSARDAIGGFGSIDEGEIASDSYCRLFYNDPFACDTVCDEGETCTTGECAPFPSLMAIGSLLLEGLEQDVVILPDSDLRYIEFEVPGAEMGSILNLKATQGYTKLFAVQGLYVEPLIMVEPKPVIAPGEPLTFSWEPYDGQQRIQFDLYVTEGNMDALEYVHELYLRCSFPDVGTGTISASIIEALRAYGPYWYHKPRIQRVTTDSAYINEGCIEFRVSSDFEAFGLQDETGDFFL